MSEDLSAGVDTTPLDEDDRDDVMGALTNVLANYNGIGGRLHLKADVLSQIQRERLTAAESMERMIVQWLNKNYNTKRFGDPTWKMLVEAVANPTGGNNRAEAKRIADAHRSNGPGTNPPPAVDHPTPAPPSNKPAIGPKDPNFFKESASVRKTVQADGGGRDKKITFEEYPHMPSHNKMKSIPFSFGTVTPQKGDKTVGIAGAYEMNSVPHGIALIINNEKFQRQSMREGTEIDEKNLILAFRYLGYTVQVHRDCGAEKICDIMEGIRMKDHSNYDSFVCCILSHGKEGQIYGSDSVMVSLDDITTKLNGDNCPSLLEKPKIFFLQACRGRMKDKGARVGHDGDEIEPEKEEEPETRVMSDSGLRIATDSDSKIPDAADFYFGYATPFGHVAWRDLDNGSWYISELCRSMASYGTHAKLEDIMKITNSEVGGVYSNVEFKQSPEATTRLRKDVFFF